MRIAMNAYAYRAHRALATRSNVHEAGEADRLTPTGAFAPSHALDLPHGRSRTQNG